MSGESADLLGEIPLCSFWYANRAVAALFIYLYIVFFLLIPTLTVCCAFITGHAVLVIGVRSRLTAEGVRGLGGLTAECKWPYLQSSADHRAVGAQIIAEAWRRFGSAAVTVRRRHS